MIPSPGAWAGALPSELAIRNTALRFEDMASAAITASWRRIQGPLLRTVRPWLVLALVCGGFSLHPDFARIFWTRDYLPNIRQQAATNIMLAVGMTFVILTGGIDLSVGAVMALSGVVLGPAAVGGPESH